MKPGFKALAVSLPVIASLAALLLVAPAAVQDSAAASPGGGMESMSIDMDPFASPGNSRGTEFGSDCSNALDDDSDGRINDGCTATPAAVGAPETGNQCLDVIVPVDNDLDGVTNDGCAEASCLDAVDNDTDGTVNDGCPAFRTGVGLGSRETCARINENDLIDADEDATADTVSLDVTATNVPASHPMMAFAFTLNYLPTALTVESQDSNFLLGTYTGSRLFNASDTTPDDDANSDWNAAVADMSSTPGETGSGVLSRITISSEGSASAGLLSLTLTNAAHIDGSNNSHVPDTINNAGIAVDQPCPAP